MASRRHTSVKVAYLCEKRGGGAIVVPELRGEMIGTMWTTFGAADAGGGGSTSAEYMRLV